MSLSHPTGAEVTWIAFAIIAGSVALWRLACRGAAYLLAAFGNAEYGLSLAERGDYAGSNDQLPAHK